MPRVVSGTEYEQCVLLDDAPAERSGDGAFVGDEAANPSGVALRLPPHSNYYLSTNLTLSRARSKRRKETYCMIYPRSRRTST